MSSTVPFEYRADPGRPQYFTGEGIQVRILPDEILGRDPYLVQARTHRKKRTNKKWAKRYGYVTKYRAFNTIVLHHAVYMTQQSWDALKKRLTERGINEPLFKQQSDRTDPGAHPATLGGGPGRGAEK